MEQTPKQLLDAIGELALAIKPHYMDLDQRQRIAGALHVLVDAILVARTQTSEPTNGKE